MPGQPSKAMTARPKTLRSILKIRVKLRLHQRQARAGVAFWRPSTDAPIGAFFIVVVVATVIGRQFRASLLPAENQRVRAWLVSSPLRRAKEAAAASPSIATIEESSPSAAIIVATKKLARFCWQSASKRHGASSSSRKSAGVIGGLIARDGRLMVSLCEDY